MAQRMHGLSGERHRLSDIRIRVQPEFCTVEGLLIAQRAGIRDQPHITRRVFLIKAAIYEIADVINAVNLMQIVILSGEFAAAGIDPFSSVFAYLQAVFADAVPRAAGGVVGVFI